MSHRERVISTTVGSLGVAGGFMVFLGTYWISWSSLTGLISSVPLSYGGSTLYHLRTFVTSGWYAYASQVMALGGVILVLSGLAVISAPESRIWERIHVVGPAAGSGIVLFAAFATGLPHWYTHEPLMFTRGAGEWVVLLERSLVLSVVSLDG